MTADLRPNFSLCDNPDRRCKNCASVGFDANTAAYCMAGQDAGAAPESGQRVNENFVCDNHSPA